jgi:hypothetical protein
LFGKKKKKKKNEKGEHFLSNKIRKKPCEWNSTNVPKVGASIEKQWNKMMRL